MPKTPTDFDRLIEPVIEECLKSRGLASEITRQLSKLLGRKIQHPQVQRWLDEDRKRRTEPAYSTALALVQAFELAKQERNGDL